MAKPGMSGLFSAVLSLLALMGCQQPAVESGTGGPEPVAPREGTALEPRAGEVSSADGVPIAWSFWNRPGAAGRPALVFVHGWQCDRGYWAAQVEAFADEYPVVTLDLAGHGASGTQRASWELSAFGEDVRAVVEALGLERVVLIGHSMGGPAILMAEPLLGDRVLALIGVDTFQNVEFEYDPEQWDGILEAYRTDYRGTCEQFVGSMFVEPESALRSRVVEDMCSGPEDIGVALMEQFGTFDGAAAMAAVEAPVRSINADTFPTQVEINRKYASGFDAVVMEGAGHFLMMEEAEDFNAALAEMIRGLLIEEPQ